MKLLTILTILVPLTITSCGRHSSSSESVTVDVLRESRRIQVGSPMEAQYILNQSALEGDLIRFHHMRWYLFNGSYMFTSKVINGTTYKLYREEGRY